jgi:dolichyl-phosphate-mannose-protein mannosyltransferase
MGGIRSPLFGTADCFAILLVSFVALATRLWLIAEPDHVTFDEVHFGNFTNWYIQGLFHFDIHPPLGKMIMAKIAALTQYKGDIEYAAKFGQPFDVNDIYYISQRITCGIFSAFTSPFIFAACRCLQLSTAAAAGAAIILTSDISLIVEGKFILSDGLLHFFVMLHVFCLCLFLARPTFWRTIWSGMTLGAAASCKYTALGLTAVDGITQLVWIIMNRPSIKEIFKRGCLMLIPAIGVFLSAWFWHFIANPWALHEGEYASLALKTTVLTRNSAASYWGNRLIGPGLLHRTWEWNMLMHKTNMRSDIPHLFESLPIRWPLMLDRGVGFVSCERDVREVYCIGNPFVYYAVFIGLVVGLIAFAFKKSDKNNALLIWGWAVSYFPFVLVPRTMFLYHYLVPLMFGVMNLVTTIQNIMPAGYKAGGIWFVAVLCFLCYVYFSPYAYALTCPDCRETRLWTERWRSGPPRPANLYGADLYTTVERMGVLPL